MSCGSREKKNLNSDVATVLTIWYNVSTVATGDICCGLYKKDKRKIE